MCGLKWSPDNQYLASGGNDNKLFVWNNHSLCPAQTYTEHNAAVKGTKLFFFFFVSGIIEKFLNIYLAYLMSLPSVSVIMFCKQFLSYSVYIDGSAFLCNP